MFDAEGHTALFSAPGIRPVTDLWLSRTCRVDGNRAAVKFPPSCVYYEMCHPFTTNPPLRRASLWFLAIFHVAHIAQEVKARPPQDGRFLVHHPQHRRHCPLLLHTSCSFRIEHSVTLTISFTHRSRLQQHPRTTLRDFTHSLTLASLSTRSLP